MGEGVGSVGVYGGMDAGGMDGGRGGYRISGKGVQM